MRRAVCGLREALLPTAVTYLVTIAGRLDHAAVIRQLGRRTAGHREQGHSWLASLLAKRSHGAAHRDDELPKPRGCAGALPTTQNAEYGSAYSIMAEQSLGAQIGQFWVGHCCPVSGYCKSSWHTWHVSRTSARSRSLDRPPFQGPNRTGLR